MKSSSINRLLLLEYFAIWLSSVGFGKCEHVRHLDAVLGDQFRISYSTNPQRFQIDYCLWTPPIKSVESKTIAIPFLNQTECGLTIEKIGQWDFGNWKFIVVMKEITFPANETQENVIVEGIVKVIPKPQFATSTVSARDGGYSDAQGNSDRNKPFLEILESNNETLNLTENTVSSITCCAQQVLDTSFLLDNENQRIEEDESNCIRMRRKFSWKDDGKLILCNGKFKNASADISHQTSSVLNLSYSPKILNVGNEKGIGNCGMEITLEYPRQTAFFVRFQSNPVGNGVWRKIHTTTINQTFSYLQATALKSEEFSTDMRPIRQNILESVIKFHNVEINGSRLQLLLTLYNSVGKCLLYVTLIPSVVSTTPRTNLADSSTKYGEAADDTSEKESNDQTEARSLIGSHWNDSTVSTLVNGNNDGTLASRAQFRHLFLVLLFCYLGEVLNV